MGKLNSKPINTISKRRWNRKTNPYLPSHVTNCLRIINRLCQRGFSTLAGSPLLHDLTVRERNNKVHGTSFTLKLLDHFSPLTGRPVARLRECSVTSSWRSPILARQSSNDSANCRATGMLKPSNFRINEIHPNSSRSAYAPSKVNSAWLPLGSALTTGAITSVHGRVSHRMHRVDRRGFP